MEIRSCKTILFAFAFAVSAIEIDAQNLVPNPSFETTTSCPNAQDQLSYAAPWLNPTANTPDYYNACTSSYMDVPQNWFGTEYARTGDAYAGFVSYYGGNGREYIEAPLLSPLLQGKSYCVSFYVSLADSCLDAISPIGAYFTTSLYNDQSTMENLNVIPQVSSPLETPLSNTVGWTLITGSFVAQGGEQYIVIGTFAPDSMLAIDSTIRPRPNNYAKFAYYYIDDVSVYEIADCISGNDTTICVQGSAALGTSRMIGVSYSWSPTIGLSDANAPNPNATPTVSTTYTLTQTQHDVISSSEVRITVDPTCITGIRIHVVSPVQITGELQIIGLEPNSNLAIYDMHGKMIYSADDYQDDFMVSSLSNGMYFIQLKRPSGEIVPLKFCVVE